MGELMKWGGEVKVKIGFVSIGSQTVYSLAIQTSQSL